MGLVKRFLEDADGTKMYDHNPTFTAISHDKRLAFRVMHFEEGDGVFSYWTDIFDPEDANVKFLTISAAKSMAVEAERVVKEWLSNGGWIDEQSPD